MKETTKASIGGYAFTLDTDAYELLNEYLINLSNHFSSIDGKDEIMDDIETRMSDLLQIKCAKDDYIITSMDAIEIIKIMGSPKDLGDENINESNSSVETKTEKDKKPAKKFYRDTDNAILGGVCSGLGHYFNIDPVIIRVILVMLVLFGGPFLGKFIGFIVVLYITLWIVTPRAVTFNQKLAMLGDNSSIENIQTGNTKSPKKGSDTSKAILKVLQIVCSVFCYLTSISIILAGITILFIPQITKLPSVNEFLNIMGISYTGVDISIIFAWFIPALILLYLGVRVFFKMNIKDLIIIGVATGIWLVSLCYVTIIIVNEAQYYQSQASDIKSINIESKSDTLYLKLDKRYLNPISIENKENNHFFKSSTEPALWFFVPCVDIIEDDSIKNFKIEVKTIAFSNSTSSAMEKLDDSKYTVDIKDSLVTITPLLFSKTNKWNRDAYAITIYQPKDKIVKSELITNR